MPRPSLGKVRFMTSLPPDLMERIDRIATDQHRTRADVIQEAVEQYADRHEKKNPAPKKK